jgi:prephenate dehydratase
LRIAYLGPAGTFTEDALREAAPAEPYEPLRTATVHEAILAVDRGEADRALVPFENSIEGSVRTTLDALAFDARAVEIAGEHDYAVRAHLIAGRKLEPEGIEAVLSHPQPLAQCARYLRERLPGAEQRSVSSTAEAVRTVCETDRPWAAIGARAAAELYGGVVLAEGIEDEATNVTRFVWIAPAGSSGGGEGPWKTSLVFAELGEDHPGALVDALREFSGRGVNLTRIESRPMRQELGRYMFFCDLEGAAAEPPVAEAIEALRGKAESVRVLGSYPVGRGDPGTPA